jgi:hypothetical protein
VIDDEINDDANAALLAAVGEFHEVAERGAVPSGMRLEFGMAYSRVT